MRSLDAIMAAAPVIPVLVIERGEDALPLGRALVGGGLPVLEVTLRTPAALDAIRAIRAIPGAIVGAGTVLDPDQYLQAVEAGAEFVVSPGLTDELAEAAEAGPVPLLPGVATAGEIMRALNHGLRHLKFFPAPASGGIPALKAFGSVFPRVRFCPTGGITLETAPDWLSLANVACIGGSWLAPAGTSDMSAITARARHAAALARPRSTTKDAE